MPQEKSFHNTHNRNVSNENLSGFEKRFPNHFPNPGNFFCVCFVLVDLYILCVGTLFMELLDMLSNFECGYLMENEDPRTNRL